MTRKEREKHLDWLYRLKSEIFVFMPKDWIIPFADSLDVAIKALEQEPTIDYRRAFKIACELLSGFVLYGIDSDKIFETAMQKDGFVSNESYERYILNHLQELDHGQYAEVEE